MPPVRPLAPSPREADSSTRTDRPGANRRNQAAAESPEKPAPTMAKSTWSGRSDGAGRKSTVQGGAPQGWALRRAAFGRGFRGIVFFDPKARWAVVRIVTSD